MDVGGDGATASRPMRSRAHTEHHPNPPFVHAAGRAGRRLESQTSVSRRAAGRSSGPVPGPALRTSAPALRVPSARARAYSSAPATATASSRMSSAGARALMSGLISRSRSLMRRLSSRMRSSSSRVIAAISRRSRLRGRRRAGRRAGAWRPRARISSSGAISCRCQRTRLAGGFARRRDRRDGGPATAYGARVRQALRPAGRARATRLGRPRARRSRRTCRFGVRCAARGHHCVGTRTTCSPTRSRSASSVRVRWRQSPSAQRRLGQRRAHAIARDARPPWRPASWRQALAGARRRLRAYACACGVDAVTTGITPSI